MIARVLSLALGAVAVVAFVIVLSGGDDQRRVRLELPSTAGLRDGSDVRVAGATIGKVASLDLGPRDVVEAELELKSGDIGVGRDATAAIKANNLLGEKYVQLMRGGRPVAEDEVVTIPASRVNYPVDLDEVLSVLDAPTRARLAILINEAGLAVTGRKVDLNRMLRMAPRSFDRATELLSSLNADNSALGRLVEQTDTFLAELAPARRDVGRFVDTAGETMETVAARRRELASTLERAPGTLRNARLLLTELRRAAQPLRPAARLLTSTAPALTGTLRAVGPFTTAAAPTLRKATATAPLLTRLGREVTPVARQAVPPLRSLRQVGEAAPPLSRALNDGADGLFGALEGWARAIQGRDSVGHVFRGHLGFGPETVTSLMRKLAPPSKSKRRTKSRRPAPRVPAPRDLPSREVQRGIGKALDDLTAKPKEVLRDLLPKVGSKPSADDRSIEPLLDFLLGR